MPMPSSFSRKQCLTVLAGAVATAFASWAYFVDSEAWLIVSGAGDAAANGYYHVEPFEAAYRKVSELPTWSWRVPNVYDLVLRRPSQYRKYRGESVYIMHSGGDDQNQQRDWQILRSLSPPQVMYRNDKREVDPGVYAPPSSGWVTVPLLASNGSVEGGGIDPPPQVEVCGRFLDPEAEQLARLERYSTGGASAFQVASGPAEMARYPVTVLFILVNLIMAYHLWAKRVSPDAVAISYSLFWEEGEYWRLVTASFSHFEPLHLLFNVMSTWNTRWLEGLLGSFRHLYLSLDLVVTTIVLVMLMKHFIIKWGGVVNQRQGKAVGFSCVIFAYMTYLAVTMGQFCPLGPSFPAFCFNTWHIPMPGGLPSLPVNLGPFGSLAFAQIMMPRAAFLGHLAGIFMGYLMSWGMLGHLSTPILVGASIILMLQHSKRWARNMPDFSLLLQGWAGGDSGRVSRAQRLNNVFAAHVCLTVAFLFWFSWGTGVAELMALVVGFNAVRALKCCCCPDSVQAEHRFCIDLLKAYGALSAVLLVSDLLSFGAVLSQSCTLECSGLSGTPLKRGLGLLVLAAAVHVSALAACVEGIVIFRDGQAFLSRIGLGKVVTAYVVRNTGSSGPSSSGGNTASATSTLPHAAAAGITAGGNYRGGGRVLGTAASNRSTQANAGRGGGGRAAAAAAASNRALSGYHLGRGRETVGGEDEEAGEGGGAGMPLMGAHRGGEGRTNAPRQMDL